MTHDHRTTPDWRRFDYADKDNTAPKGTYEPVWIREDQYEEDVTIGYFDGYTFRVWGGSDDCSVSWWAPIDYPADPCDRRAVNAEPEDVTHGR